MTRSHTAQILARLSGGALDFESIPGRSYGALTSSDIAASLNAITDPLARLYVQIKLCGSEGDYPKLRRGMLLLLADRAIAGNWKGLGKGFLSNLTSILLESTIPAQTCTTCNGTKSLPATEVTPIVVCAGCDGSGRRPARDDIPARLGITGREYSNKWRQRILDLERMIYDMENLALYQVGAYLEAD